MEREAAVMVAFVLSFDALVMSKWAVGRRGPNSSDFCGDGGFAYLTFS